MKTFIYTLNCPITGEVKYIGKTMRSLKERLRSHIGERNVHKSLKNSWIIGLINQKLKPIIELLDEVDDDWQFWEIYWISQFKTWGYNLKNLTAGGEGLSGKKHTPETIEKMRFAKKGKISKLKGKTYKEIYGDDVIEILKNHSESLKGKTYEEIYGKEQAKVQKEKLSIAQKKIGHLISERIKKSYENGDMKHWCDTEEKLQIHMKKMINARYNKNRIK